MTTTTTTPPTTSPRLSPAARRWSKRIEAGEMTHGQVRSFAGLVARMAEDLPFLGNGGQGGITARTTLTPDEAVLLVAILSGDPVRIPDELTETGRRWLERWSAERLPGFPTDRLRDFSHYTYAGEHAPVDAWRSVPVWRVHFTDGGPFLTYAVTSARIEGMNRQAQTPGNWNEGAW